jgi:hypothetical protein
MLRSDISTSIQGYDSETTHKGKFHWVAGFFGFFIQTADSAGWETGGKNRKGGIIPGISKLNGADEWNLKREFVRRRLF